MPKGGLQRPRHIRLALMPHVHTSRVTYTGCVRVRRNSVVSRECASLVCRVAITLDMFEGETMLATPLLWGAATVRRHGYVRPTNRVHLRAPTAARTTGPTTVPTAAPEGSSGNGSDCSPNDSFNGGTN